MYVLIMAAALPNSMEPGIFRYNSLACALLCLASFLIHPICRKNMQKALSLLALALRTFCVSAIAGGLAALLAELGTYGVGRFQWADWAVSAVQCTLILFLWCSLYFIIKQWKSAVKERERLLIMEAEMKEAKLSALRYQLNPHFLFNSLNAVSTLYLEENADAATDMLAQVCDLLRAVLSGDMAPTIPFSQEIDFINKYLAIEKTRLGARLNIVLTIAPECMDVLVPNMLLQPLMENAVKHGVAPVAGPGFVSLRSYINDTRLHIIVKNSGLMHTDGGAETAPPQGIGLANTVERLKTIYDSNHSFTVQWPTEGGCEVRIELPCQRIAVWETPTCAC